MHIMVEVLLSYYHPMQLVLEAAVETNETIRSAGRIWTKDRLTNPASFPHRTNEG